MQVQFLLSADRALLCRRFDFGRRFGRPKDRAFHGERVTFLPARSVTGEFGDLSPPPDLPGGLTFEMIHSPTDVGLPVVPEPATSALAAVGPVVVIRRRRQ